MSKPEARSEPQANVVETGGLAALRRGARPGLRALRGLRERGERSDGEERCEMCATPIADFHGHVVNVESRSLLCTCRACTLLFTQQGAARGRFRAVPERSVFVPDFQLSEARWEEFQIPVRIAFFFHNSALGRIAAFYPSPAGATESLLPLEEWRELEAENPILGGLEPDVEALLVWGPRERDGFDCLLAPIDTCYELTGIVRRTWRGFDGGEEAHAAIRGFFERVRARSVERPAGSAP